MVSWEVELSEYDIQYVLANLLVEFSSPVGEEAIYTCILSIGGILNLKRSGTIIVLEGPYDLLIDMSLKFKFKDSNN